MAVIDVGSNSVRLVLYRLEGRAIWTVFNEKVLAGLGEQVGQTGWLSPKGVTTALQALRRFRAVLDGGEPAQVFCAATAAVREARDGRAFVDRVRAETGLQVRVLSGEEEARYAALGVSAGQPDAGGLVGDLGGSSLELVRIEGGEPGRGVTLPLGPFALGAPSPPDPQAVLAEARKRLRRFSTTEPVGCVHAVGGAWRNLALIQMTRQAYPLRIVHGFEMELDEALDAARFVAQSTPGVLERMPGVSKKRAETLPYSALVLQALLETTTPQRLCFSAYGVREGLLLEALSPELRRRDPLVEGCAAIGARQGASETLGPALEAWLTPLWTALPPVFKSGRDAVLLAAACRLADLGARLHPDHRADLVFDQVLRAPVAGQSHAERAFLANAVFARYTSTTPVRPEAGVERLLNPERQRRAQALGAAMRLGSDLSGHSAGLLARARLALDGRAPVLHVADGYADLVLGETTRKRLASLAAALKLEHRHASGAVPPSGVRLRPAGEAAG